MRLLRLFLIFIIAYLIALATFFPEGLTPSILFYSFIVATVFTILMSALDYLAKNKSKP